MSRRRTSRRQSHARASWQSPSREWQVAIDVHNLGDKVYYQNIVDGVYTTVGYQSAQIGPPRMWTMSFSKSFGSLVRNGLPLVSYEYFVPPAVPTTCSGGIP